VDLPKLKDKPVTKAPALKKLFGPSFIILGLGLGSGEVILWPYLSSNYGLGIVWGAVLGITFQFFMNTEISRYTLFNGESIFTGFARKSKVLPFWFLLSTFIPWIWPGIIAASAKVAASLFGFQDSHYVAIGFLILIGLVLSIGPVLYKTVESFQKIVISLGVPSIFLLSILLADKFDFLALTRGIAGFGDGYYLLPIGIPLASFLAALAYSGAGGNLNLAQSFYIKEKGYLMGKYSGRISSLITGKAEEISLTGANFKPTKENLAVAFDWWKKINTEHFIVFWLTGSLTILLLSLLAFSTTFGMEGNFSDINFVLNEAMIIGQRMFPAVGVFFLILVTIMLFGTQLTVLDATSRILTENIAILGINKIKTHQIPSIYYFVLWIQIIAGILIFMIGVTQPLQLLTISAILNAFAMFVHVGLTLWLNKTSLHKELQPNIFRTTMMILAFLLYGGFSLYTIQQMFFN